MNAKTQAAIENHGENLLRIFPNATERDPVKLCKKLRKLEREGAALGLRLCNGPEFESEGEADEIEDAILARCNALLGNEAGAVPIFLNRDPRGYALKVSDGWQRERVAAGKPYLYGDWGGYGILAPDLTTK